MPIILDGTAGITSPGGDTSNSLTTGTLTATTENITNLTTSKLTIGTTQLGAGNASIMKNRIINGAMVIDQRNAGASVTPTDNQYLLDRWAAGLGAASKYTVQQNAGSVTPPVGFTNYLGVTSTSAYSISSSDYFYVVQKIEGYNVADLGWGTANAKTVTLSFQVYSSLTGTFGGALRNSAANRSYPFTYSIPVANTWTTISVTIAGDTTGTWLTTNGVGIYVDFGLGVGSTYSATAGTWAAGNYVSATGATSVVGTNGATFYITGVQFEVGSSATGFEYRQYGTELQLCQRYYYKNGVSPTTNQMTWLVGVITSATGLTRAIMRHPVPMRATPTFGYSALRGYDGSNATAVSSISLNQCSTDMVQIDFVCSGASFTTGRAGLILEGSSSSYIDCTAEL